ncbi:MAG: hypothetical protein HGB14_01995 [Anaerolineaceae bacterium]|nr:hypothetical protein [Anaerolineaceae bacterium]
MIKRVFTFIFFLAFCSIRATFSQSYYDYELTAINFSGNSFFSESKSSDLQNVANDAMFLKFLNRGTQLRSRLAEIWRTTGCYNGAGQAVAIALTREHFSATTKKYRGIHVMTLHKSKGKQFTEVIIYEGPERFRDKIVRQGFTAQDLARGRLILRVGVTRAEKHTLILSPAYQACPLI